MAETATAERAVPENAADGQIERCTPHGNKMPCPLCLTARYRIWVWNNL